MREDARNLGRSGWTGGADEAKKAAATAGVEEGSGNPCCMARGHRHCSGSLTPPRAGAARQPLHARDAPPDSLLHRSWKHFPVGLWGAGAAAEVREHKEGPWALLFQSCSGAVSASMPV